MDIENLTFSHKMDWNNLMERLNHSIDIISKEGSAWNKLTERLDIICRNTNKISQEFVNPKSLGENRRIKLSLAKEITKTKSNRNIFEQMVSNQIVVFNAPNFQNISSFFRELELHQANLSKFIRNAIVSIGIKEYFEIFC